MNLETEVAGIRLEHPLMNAAGTCKTLEDVEKLAQTATAAIMVGSITVAQRSGNTGQVYWPTEMYSLNSLGLPNRGLSYFRTSIRAMVDVAHGAGKPLFVSVAGFSPEEYGTLSGAAFEDGADLVEVNLACPNVWQGGTQKRIACFDPKMVDEILSWVHWKSPTGAKVAAKISPFSDPFALAEVAAVLASVPMVKAVTTSNTFPNAFAFDGPRPSITAGNGLAGFAGPAFKPIALGQVRQLRGLLPENIQIIGVGGITHGRDISEYRESGAVAVQIATAYLERHGQVFSNLLEEYLEDAPQTT